jgi:hypothetical protein
MIAVAGSFAKFKEERMIQRLHDVVVGHNFYQKIKAK